MILSSTNIWANLQLSSCQHSWPRLQRRELSTTKKHTGDLSKNLKLLRDLKHNHLGPAFIWLKQCLRRRYDAELHTRSARSSVECLFLHWDKPWETQQLRLWTISGPASLGFLQVHHPCLCRRCQSSHLSNLVDPPNLSVLLGKSVNRTFLKGYPWNCLIFPGVLRKPSLEDLSKCRFRSVVQCFPFGLFACTGKAGGLVVDFLQSSSFRNSNPPLFGANKQNKLFKKKGVG